MSKGAMRGLQQPVVPSNDALQQAIAAVLGRVDVTILHRRSVFESRQPNEAIDCRLADGTLLTLFCKYGDNEGASGHGHRRTVEYEEAVYRSVLAPLGITRPHFYGSYVPDDSQARWLFLEYLEGHARASAVDAARWAGSLHARAAALPATVTSQLTTYDADYYLGWSRRTARFVDSRRDLRWVALLCGRFEDLVSNVLLALPQSVIHGEYNGSNVLECNGNVHPVDWESAAVGPGEIDLAGVVDGLSDSVAAECRTTYANARRPEGSAYDAEQAFDAANVYWHLRWLGDRPSWTASERMAWRFGRLRTIGERLGLI